MKGYEYTDMELKKLNIIQSVIDGIRTGKEASITLDVSQRQIWRLVNKVKTLGMVGVKHGNKSHKPSHSFSEDLKQKIIELKFSNDYCDTNFTHFKELLEEREDIKISYTPLYKMLTASGIKSKKKHKDRKTHRRRKRKSYEGELIQADGTPFDWFKNGKMYSLHGFIDDATSKVLGLYMCEHECLLGYLEVTRQMLLNHGVPIYMYPDKFSVFFPANAQKLTIAEQLEGKKTPVTQFGRIMDILGIDMFAASTSQAKGRIERLWETLQDRLVTEFKLAGINTIQEANNFLPSYIKKHNKKFTIAPEIDESKFLPLPSYIEINFLLASKISRTIDNGGNFSIDGKRFQIIDNKIIPNTKVDIYMSQKIGIIAEYNNTRYKVICSDNVPNTYSSLTFDKFCKENSEPVNLFVNNILTYNAKEREPLLTSS